MSASCADCTYADGVWPRWSCSSLPSASGSRMHCTDRGGLSQFSEGLSEIVGNNGRISDQMKCELVFCDHIPSLQETAQTEGLGWSCSSLPSASGSRMHCTDRGPHRSGQTAVCLPERCSGLPSASGRTMQRFAMRQRQNDALQSGQSAGTPSRLPSTGKPSSLQAHRAACRHTAQPAGTLRTSQARGGCSVQCVTTKAPECRACPGSWCSSRAHILTEASESCWSLVDKHLDLQDVRAPGAGSALSLSLRAHVLTEASGSCWSLVDKHLDLQDAAQARAA